MKNDMQAKYFNVLKARYVHKTNIRKVSQLQNAIYKRVAFKALAKVSLRTRLYKQLVRQRSLNEKQKLFTSWRYETSEHQIISSY